MSTFRVVNNYSDGFVDKNGFIRQPGYLHLKIEELNQKIVEINKEIDMLDPDDSNNDFIVNIENNINTINEEIKNSQVIDLTVFYYTLL